MRAATVIIGLFFTIALVLTIITARSLPDVTSVEPSRADSVEPRGAGTAEPASAWPAEPAGAGTAEPSGADLIELRSGTAGRAGAGSIVPSSAGTAEPAGNGLIAPSLTEGVVGRRTASSRNSDTAAIDPGFTFVRIRFESTLNRWGEPWAYDYPRAERHLYEAIERTTGIHVEGPPIVLDLTDERIFEYPILYLCEPGFWQTNDDEVASLQRYFARGGFMIIDDFHDGGRGSVGPEWNNFYQNIKQIFPDREPVELTADHPIWSIYYDIDPDAAISTKIETGQTPWLGPADDIYYGIFDDDGRLMCVICYNQDIGDGWEWPQYNFHDGSTVSFQMAINFILYALTH